MYLYLIYREKAFILASSFTFNAHADNLEQDPGRRITEESTESLLALETKTLTRSPQTSRPQFDTPSLQYTLGKEVCMPALLQGITSFTLELLLTMKENIRDQALRSLRL